MTFSKQGYGSRYQPEAFLSGNLVGSGTSEGLIHMAELLIKKGADVNGPIRESTQELYRTTNYRKKLGL
jgi:hypothetical protein